MKKINRQNITYPEVQSRETIHAIYDKFSATYFPVLPSHNLMDLSNDALASSLVSGENRTSLMSCW